MKTVGLLAAVGLSLAACEFVNAPSRPAEPGGDAARPAASAFAHSHSDDISGYYRASGVSAGDLTLAQVFVGQTQEFEAWEAGRRSTTFAPVMVELTRGGETLRVLPTRYSVSDGRVSMQGTAPGVGEVSVDLRLDKGALATARRNLGGSDEATMTGSVRIGGRSFSGVKLNWYGGD
ncbi:hypothetical protein ACETK8_13580 [Brevundimonas staleyi]|uniref:DUF4251 domain-containing protein n=1 Tax=Brevundimonas staleyi TaxID=74326 RepID=A0ABW0FM84_9CAUL